MVDPFGGFFDIQPGFIPVDMQTGANSGAYISLKNAEGVYIVLYKGVGTGGDDPTISLQQAQDVSGTAVKDLDGVVVSYKKEHATAIPGTWTRTAQAADEDLVLTSSAAKKGIYVYQVETSLLDVANGFDCIAANVADIGGNAQLGCLLYILYGLRFGARPDGLLSPIVD